jgi:hypothetical protein
MLVKAADDQLGSVVGARDDRTLNAIDQRGPVPLERVKDACDCGCWDDVLLPQSDQRAIAFLSSAAGLGLKDGVDLLLESDNVRARLGIVLAIGVFELAMCPLTGVKDALVVAGVRKDLSNRWSILRA